jgi:hypothetical protein
LDIEADGICLDRLSRMYHVELVGLYAVIVRYVKLEWMSLTVGMIFHFP